jgi:hypothetical protein
MKHFRFSIGGLMVVILLLSVAFAALRYPTPLWANFWYSFALAVLTLAVPAAFYRRGEQRAFWVGFASCGWVYFVLALAPWFERDGGFQFVTTTALDIMAPHVIQKDYLVRSYVTGFRRQYGPPDQPTPWQVWNLPDFPPDNPWHKVGYVTLISPGVYLRIGHSFCCVLVAVLGGGIVRYLAATCPQPTSAER